MRDENQHGAALRIWIVVLCAAVCAAGILVWSTRPQEQTTPPSGSESGADSGEEIVLAGRNSDFLIEANLGESLAELSFERRDGTSVSLQEWQGQNLVLFFWASWCPYCKESLEQMNAFERICQAAGDTSLLLVDILDADRETVAAAERCLQENSITAECVFDRDGAIYRERIGIQKMPMWLILSQEGRLLGAFQDAVTQPSVFQSMLYSVINNYDAATLRFITGEMQGADGGMYTSLEEQAESPSGRDVLSESQGLLMEYAVAAGNRELFDSAYQYAREYLERNGLFLWYCSADGQGPTSNAFLDDLRIYGALLQAQELWGGYDKDLERLEQALCRYNLVKGNPVDFYDFSTKQTGDSFSLCYSDLNSIRAIAERCGIDGLYENTLKILENGYISDEFPFYYAAWSYVEQDYSEDDLNMIEAMYTLYHLAKDGRLRDSSKQWLLEQLKGNGIMARYRVDGSVVPGYGYESTGIYALAAMVGVECDDADMISLAVARMNQMRIYDSAIRYDGAFGNTDGTGIYSFDQCMALCAYEKLNKWMALETDHKS